MIVAVGCGKPPNFTNTKPKPKPEPRRVNVEAGEITKRGKKELWLVRWKHAALEYTDDQRFSGVMDDVTGILYQDGKAVSTFKADQAVARKEDSVLKLDGRVVVTSKSPQVAMMCQNVLYDGEAAVVEASGAVRVDSTDYETGPWEKVLATPDLKTVATPDLFGANRAKKK